MKWYHDGLQNRSSQFESECPCHMCETAPSFLIEFNRRLNLHLARYRRPWKFLPAVWMPEYQEEGQSKVYFNGLTQKLIPQGGPWGFDGLEYLTQTQSDMMDSIIKRLEELEIKSFFGMDGEKFFIIISGTLPDALLLKLSI